MKNYFLKVVILTAVLLCTKNLNAQKVFKIGDEFDSDIKVTKSYQKFKRTASKINEKELVYKKEFFSENSSYIKIYFKNFDLAPGDYVKITGSKSKESIIYGGQGKIVDNNMTMISDFWSKVLFDEKVEVKLYSSGKASKHNGFEISKVAYGYSEERIMKKLANQRRSICSNDDKERISCYQGTEMYEKAKAVCRLLIGGSSLCTGWLLGNEGHLMTNNHCIGSASDAQNTDFMFNYQYDGCSGSTNAQSNVVASSATFVKTNSSLDYTLVKLPVNPTNTYGFLSLSSAVTSKGDRIYIPQHPGGRRKEISVKSDRDATPDGFSRVFESSSGSGQQVRYYADTEGGSSGSPVLDYNSNLVIAIHNTGGCPNGSYGRSDNLISSIGSDMPAKGVDNNGGGGNPPGGSCSNTVSSFPYNQSFENTIGNWKQSTSDDFNWATRSGSTPSSNTGPTSANAGSYYLYMESSSPNYSNKSAIITSPCFDLKQASNASLSFKYHMYGTSAMGNLKVEVSIDKGVNWTSVWQKSGNQGNSWQTASVNLDSYVGKDVQVRFNGVTGTTWQGDMAIDQLSVSTGSTGGGNSTVSLEITFDNYSSETSWEITNSSNTVVASGNNYNSQASGSKITVNKTLPNGCYSLIFKDSYGDGICCSYGNGSYKLTNSSGTVLASGGQFTSTDTKAFCIGTNAVENAVEVFTPTSVVIDDLMVYPNPSNSVLNIIIPERKLNGSYRIVNLTGAVIKKGSLSKSISVEEIKAGFYVLEVESTKHSYSKSFIKTNKN
ncbi:trypsin-like peptidase domain-containing protein [Tenacibaculum halocynthiae]|uniref:trypsin-like peptidase domain-containing protein n=1 Tax=Tenacibaculum halocynthiae TaxID=1254437 RepID=UPI0038936A26